MRTLIRHLVMWLLALALPLQGAAAATRLHCEPAPKAVSASLHARMAHHHAAHADDGRAASHHADTAAGFDAPEQVSSSHEQGPAQGTKVSCSACAACCTAAAMPAAPLVVAAADNVETVLPVASDVTAIFLTGGPERPPRRFLA